MNKKIVELIEDDNFKVNSNLLNKSHYMTKKGLFLNDDELNKLIKEVKKYLNKTNYNKELKNYLTLIIVSLIEMNGKQIDDIIYKTIKNTLICFEYGTTVKLAKKYGLSYDNKDIYDIEGITSLKQPKNLWNDKKIIIPKTLIVVGKNNNPIKNLDNLTHEFRHSLTSIRNTNYYLNKSIFIRRMGLSKYEFLENTNNPIILNNEIDEAFNTYYTEILVNQILRYKNIFIDDEEIRNILQSINIPSKSDYYCSNSYILSKIFIQPIINNYEMSREINNQSIKGNINSLNLDKIDEQLKIVLTDIYDYYLNKNIKDLNQINNNINRLKTKIIKKSMQKI